MLWMKLCDINRRFIYPSVTWAEEDDQFLALSYAKEKLKGI